MKKKNTNTKPKVKISSIRIKKLKKLIINRDDKIDKEIIEKLKNNIEDTSIDTDFSVRLKDEPINNIIEVDSNIDNNEIKEDIRKIKKRGISLSLLTISMLVIVAILATSYASLQYENIQSQVNNIKFGCFNISFSEVTNTQENRLYRINLDNTYPMSDTKGLEQEPYQFTITNNCSNSSEEYDSYTMITINTIKTNTLSESYIKYALQENNGTISTPQILSSVEEHGDIALDDSESQTSYIIKTTDIAYGSPKTYKLWMWLDKSAGNELQSKTFEARVTVYRQVVEGETYQASEITLDGLPESNVQDALEDLYDKFKEK